MKRLLRLAIIIGFFTIARAQDSRTLFTPLSEAAVEHGSTAWERNYAYTDPGAVIYYDGQFHMFRNAFQGWPAPVQIDYMTSADAITWTEVNDHPVLTTDDVPFAKVAALASSVIVQDDGTWVLYFYMWNTRAGSRGEGQIGRATTNDPSGIWTVDPEPVLTAGSAGSWDEQQVNSPAVLKTADGYVMYYAGYDQAGNTSGKIGMATSEDGIIWAKYDDPTTTDAPFAESDPILIPDEGWEGKFVNQPRVLHTDDGWVMLYRASGAVPAKDMGVGLATSDDGITWTKYSSNPVFKPQDAAGRFELWFTAAMYHDGAYYLMAELSAQHGSPTTDIVATIYEGALPPEG